MTSELSPDEYEALYEDGLWRHGQSLAAYAQASPETETQAAARLIVDRANLDGILRQQANAKNATKQVRESARALQHIFRFQHVPTWQPPPQARTKENQRSVAHSFQGTVDDFFEMYPECMKQNPDCNDDDDESSSSSDEEDFKPKAKKPLERQEVIDVDAPHPSRLSAARQKEHQQEQHEPTKAPPPQRQPVNPYARKAPVRPQLGEFSYTPPDDMSVSYDDRSSAASRPPPQPHNSIYSSTNNPSYDNPDYSAAWEDHHRQNPFQTAREFSAVEKDTRNHHQHHPARPSQNGGRAAGDAQPLHNPYDPPAAQPPPIPESLRRKYRPPVKQSGAAPKSGQTQQKKPSSSSHSSDNNDKDDDEDDLPEELKRFGKELVQKIENEIMDGGDPITFDDIAGLHDAKQTIQEVICWPMKRPDLFTGLRRAPNGLLLYGPPGTGKTLIGKAIAHESGATFFSISSSSLTSKWIGEGEKLVRTMFAVAAVREPSVVFIDEIDSLLTQRKADENEASRRIKTEFLVQLDGTGTTAQGRVLTIGATNRPQELDEAARRRFVKRLYIPLPIEADRATLLNVLLGKNKHRLTSQDVEKLAKETDGFSGADLKALCTDAAMGPIRKLGARALQVEAADVPPISYKHFRQSLRSMKPSVAPSDLVQYEEWDKIYGSKRIDEEMEDESSDEDK